MMVESHTLLAKRPVHLLATNAVAVSDHDNGHIVLHVLLLGYRLKSTCADIPTRSRHEIDFHCFNSLLTL